MNKIFCKLKAMIFKPKKLAKVAYNAEDFSSDNLPGQLEEINNKVQDISYRITYAMPGAYSKANTLWMLRTLRTLITHLEDYDPEELQKLRSVAELAFKIKRAKTNGDQQKAINELSILLEDLS